MKFEQIIGGIPPTKYTLLIFDRLEVEQWKEHTEQLSSKVHLVIPEIEIGANTFTEAKKLERCSNIIEKLVVESQDLKNDIHKNKWKLDDLELEKARQEETIHKSNEIISELSEKIDKLQTVYRQKCSELEAERQRLEYEIGLYRAKYIEIIRGIDAKQKELSDLQEDDL